MKKTKVGMNGINWILSIFGILFFLSLIVLPPVFRNFLNEEKEEELPEESPATVSRVNVTTCQRKDDMTSTEYVIRSLDNSILMFAQTYKNEYPEGEDMTLNCQIEATNYQNIPGFYHTCNTDGSSMVIESRVQLDQFQGDREVPVLFDLKQSAETVENEILNLGFTCETREEQ